MKGFGHGLEPRRRDADEIVGNVLDPLLEPRFSRLPAGAAKAVQGDRRIVRSITRQHFYVFDRNEKTVASGVAQPYAVVWRAGHVKRLQPFVAPDAVFRMDDKVADVEVRYLGQKGVGVARPLAAADQAVAQNILLRDNGEIAGGEAV